MGKHRFRNSLLTDIYVRLCAFVLLVIAAGVAVVVLFSPLGGVTNGTGNGENHHPNATLAIPSVGHASCSRRTGHELLQELQTLQRDLAHHCRARGVVSWSTFASDPAAHQGKYVDLGDADFKYGTLRLRHPACLRLVEDVEVDFSPHYDHRVNTSDVQYRAAAYRAGYFAAVTIETHHWLFDLGGHTMRQSVAFNLQQRPYAHISLTDRPFLSRQGPADFGTDAPVSASHGAIFNGRLARSSHHGIHGNGPSHILVDNLHLVDYEVAGIALNGPTDIVVQNTILWGTNQRIPVRGFYNQARVLLPIVDRVLSLTHDAGDTTQRDELVDARNRLSRLTRNVYEDVVERNLGHIDATRHPEAHRLFHNEGGRMDGNTYGILLHAPGFAVEGFVAGGSPSPAHILLSNVSVLNTTARVREVVALENVDTSVIVTGPVGDVLRVELVADLASGGSGVYVGDALSETQMMLTAYTRTLALDTVQWKAYVGTLSIDHALLGWRRHELQLTDLVRDGHFRYRRNGDTMFHVNKGVFGIRIDGGSDICVRDVTVAQVYNAGDRGQMSPLAGENPYALPLYDGANDGGHPAQNLQHGYMGADARGISIAGTRRLVLERVRVSDVQSEWGLAHGIDLFNGAMNCALQHVRLERIETLEHFDHHTTTPLMGTKIGQAIGLRLAEDTSDVLYYGLIMQNITSGILGCAHNLVIDAVHAPSNASRPSIYNS